MMAVASFTRPLARLGRAAAGPGALAWGFVVLLLAPLTLWPRTTTSLLLAAPLLASAVLLLATSANWRADRAKCEWLGLAIVLFAITASTAAFPRVLQLGLAPIAELFGAMGVLALAEWKFAPDTGQRGVRWALRAVIRPALPVALGIAVMLPWLAPVVASPALGWIAVALLAAAALAGRAFDRMNHTSATRAARSAGSRADTPASWS